MNKVTSIGAGIVSVPAAGKVGADPSELSSVEKVLVRDSWNKFLAQDGAMAGLFFERLVSRAPELEAAFGLSIVQAPIEFLALFDMAVRALDPATEQSLREAYHAAPAATEARCKSIAECGSFFATYGMTPKSWESAREAFLWAFSKAAYLEEYERTDLARGDASALGRFFRLHVEAPMTAIREAQDKALLPDIVARMRAGAEAMLAHPQEAGVFFYKSLFEAYPEIVSLFRTANMDALSRHLIDTVVFLIQAAGRNDGLREELQSLALIHQVNQIPASEYGRLAGPLLETLSRFGFPLDEEMTRGWEVLFGRVAQIISEPMLQQERILAEAGKFIDQVAVELGWSRSKTQKRLSAIAREVRATGSYTHTNEELDYGAKLAWRNAPKCIGRISWKNLIVRDFRHVSDANSIYDECVQHLRTATNGGNIEIVLTVFRPLQPGERWGPRLWNSQLVRYACHEMPDGSLKGDRANLDLTRAILKLGWTPPEPRGEYDLLPLVVEIPGEMPKLFPLDASEVLEVPISHPTEPKIAALGMKWCAVPAISNFQLEIGGIQYGCAPFNGWFMGTEIARDLWEPMRYDRATEIANALGLDTSSERTLWRDRAFLELNVAILHSFQEARVTLVDHQTASRQFLMHDLREKRSGRECPAQGSWVVPATGGSTTPVWHHEMRDFHLTPSYKYAADRWLAHMDEDVADAATADAPARPRTARPLIIYASETGTAENYAHQAARRLSGLSPNVRSIDDVSIEELAGASRVLAIVATCRDGNVPDSGEPLVAALTAAAADRLVGTRFAVLGIGNRIYPHFCRAAHIVDGALAGAGADRMATLETADEIAGQTDVVKRWIDMFFKRWGAEHCVQEPRRPLIELIPPQRETSPEPWEFGTIGFNDEMLVGQEEGSGAARERSTRSIGINLPAALLNRHPEGAYAVGDHIAIYPENPADLVARLCEHLGMPHDGWFRALGSSTEALDRYRDGYSIRKLFAEDLDLSLPPAPEELLAAMVEAGGEGRERLRSWLRILQGDDDKSERQQILARLREDYLTVVDLFESFPDSIPGFETLIQFLPRLKPRLYSIASSPHAHPGQVRIMVSVLTIVQANGRLSRGIASHYLAGLVPGAQVRIALKPASRHLPADPDGPVIMIAAGTGIAPLFAALEDRVSRGVRSTAASPVALYFGCRNEGELLERRSLLGWRAEGFLGRMHVAFSRAGPAKAYVQDALDADSVALAAEILHPGSHIMICGDAKMAHDVENRLVLVLQRDGGLSYSAATDLLNRMREEGRYIGDVWGIQMNYKIAVPAMIEAKYNRGASWFARLRKTLKSRPSAVGSIQKF